MCLWSWRCTLFAVLETIVSSAPVVNAGPFCCREEDPHQKEKYISLSHSRRPRLWGYLCPPEDWYSLAYCRYLSPDGSSGGCAQTIPPDPHRLLVYFVHASVRLCFLCDDERTAVYTRGAFLVFHAFICVRISRVILQLESPVLWFSILVALSGTSFLPKASHVVVG